MTTAQRYFDSLNDDYLEVHKMKEDLFWKTYMGISEDHEAFAKAEINYKRFVSDATRIPVLKEHLDSLKSLGETDSNRLLKGGLEGWLHFFQCNALENEQAKKDLAELIEMEANLFAKRKSLQLFHIDEKGERVEASTLVLRSSMETSDSEDVRQSSHQGFLTLEKWVVENGYPELVKQRNKFARSLGYQNYFDYSIQKQEAMTPQRLFEILDDFELKTRDALHKSLDQLESEKGSQALEGHNFRYFSSGDIEKQLDPYFPFSKSIERWVTSFKRLGIEFREGDLTLDLMDRKGKHENGFMHGPIPCFINKGEWQPAQINFTSNANPDKIGSGRKALATLFHEGGHAAHFSNITQNSPCFSQEFAPTSMAYAETQSMFCDSILDDADWLKIYAKNKDGEIIPDELIKGMIKARQPFFTFEERSILAVPYFEWAVYSLKDDELNGEKLIQLARETERKILGLTCSPRPLLAIPHLLAQDAACSYHGYLLAHMAVYQTRAWFLKETGYLTDNPRIGPLLATHYWNPGNSKTLDQILRSLTGEGFTAQYLAEQCNMSADEAWLEANQKLHQLSKGQTGNQSPSSLKAKINIVHGKEILASNREGDQKLINQFEEWVQSHYSPG